MFWVVKDGHQGLAFIDPKGLRLAVGPDDPKVRFFETIKEIQDRLADSEVTLESFIVSTTPLALVRNKWNRTREWLAEHHILFPDDDPDYIGKLVSPLTQPD